MFRKVSQGYDLLKVQRCDQINHEKQTSSVNLQKVSASSGHTQVRSTDQCSKNLL